VQYASLKTDTTISGKTVQEVLQTGEHSLQTVVNKKLKEYVKNGEKKVADEIIILFPKDISSGTAKAGTSPFTTATIDPKLQSSSGSVYSKLGVIESTSGDTHIQQDSVVNELGSAGMGYDLSRLGDPANQKETAVLKNGVWTRGDITTNPKEGSLRFAQNVDIPTVINTVLMLSDYPKTALDSNNTDKNGMKPWWRIDTQVYCVDTKANMTSTGDVPKIIVYRVIPYRAHSSATSSPNQPPLGMAALKKQVCKHYDYIFTGKNTEVIRFDIDFSVNFSNLLAADG
jgi:hypothetical protein